MNQPIKVSESAILSTLRTGVVVHAADTSILYSNPRAAELLGMTEDQLRGRTAVDPAWHFLDGNGAVLPLAQYPIAVVLQTQKPLANMVLGIVSPAHQAVVWVMVNAEPFFDDAGVLSHVSVNFYDISPQKTLELALAQSNEWHRMLLRNSSDGLCVINDGGRIEEASDSFCEMLGYARDRVLGMHVSEWDAAFSPEQLEQIVAKVIADGVRVQFETRHKTSKGQIFPVEVSAVPVNINDQKLIFCLTRDITNRIELEQERLNHQAELERLVDVRTAELQAAKIAAEEASLAKSAFLANMSHELRTPINAIFGMTHLIRRGALSDEQVRRLDALQASSDHLLKLIDSILELSKIEAGHVELEEAPIDIRSVLVNVLSMIHERAEAKHLELRTEICALPEGLVGDATRIQQATLNYVANAVKFTEVGHITLRVILLEDAATSVLIRIEVQDSGIGIDASVLPRLFHDFEQADNSTTRKYGGTGLGLAVTKRLAELMGGNAGVESTPGVGSRFWFSARLKKLPPQVRKTPSVKDEGAESVIRASFAGARVLLVEDEPFNREIAETLLADAGLAVECAEDGLAAVEKVTQNRYDLVLMDVQMPIMNGFDATQRIRERLGTQLLPIVAMTANAFNEDRRRCLDAGMNDFITKPLRPDALFETVLKWLRATRGR